jgi:Fe2+ or Zn2+ uptake regulation protein
VRADFPGLLRQRGLCVTPQRLAILRAVSRTPHVTAEVVAESVRREIGSGSTQTLYDALTALTDRGLLRRIRPADSPARYEDRVGDNHHIWSAESATASRTSTAPSATLHA